MRKNILKENVDMKKKLNEKVREQKAITLIVLVITIVVLLILASVSIATLTGENGILTKVTTAKEKTNEANIKEEVKLLLLEWKMDENLSGIKMEGREGETTSGAKVKYSSGVVTYTTKDGKTYTMAYVDEQLGNVEEDIADTSSQAYKARHPEKHIPTGFSYKEGTTSTGYVITDGTNEFVWIPVASEANYEKRAGVNNWAMTSSGGNSSNIGDMVRGDTLGVNSILGTSVTSTLDANQPEAQIVNNAGGFWVGRYEAGVANEAHDNIVGINGGTSDSTSANTLNTYWEERKNDIVVKQDAEPVRNITQAKALEIANSWKSEDASNGKVAYQSGLITGTQWDVMCDFIGWNVCNSDCTSWGNYANIASANYETYHSSDCASDWKRDTTTKGTSNNRWIFTTGKFVNSSNGNTAKKNIYDVAGNVWEWTTEVPQYSANNGVIRGGSALGDGSDHLATYRNGSFSSSVFTYWSIGLRFVLYVQ